MVRIEKGRHKKTNNSANDGTSEVQPTHWNDDHAQTGIVGNDGVTSTLSSGAFLHSEGVHVIAAESGTTDDLTTVTLTDSQDNDEFDLYADTGDTITVLATGNIVLEGQTSLVLSETVPVHCVVQGANVYVTSHKQAAEYFIAASNAPLRIKNQAWRVCDGTNDEADIKAAIDAFTSPNGGRIILSSGTFYFDDECIINESNVTIEGQGNSTLIDVTGMADGKEAFRTSWTQDSTTEYEINDVTAGDTTLTLDTGTEEDNFAVGDYICLHTDLSINSAATALTAVQGDYYKIESVTSDDTGVIGIEGGAMEAYANTPSIQPVEFRGQSYTQEF